MSHVMTRVTRSNFFLLVFCIFSVKFMSGFCFVYVSRFFFFLSCRFTRFEEVPLSHSNSHNMLTNTREKKRYIHICIYGAKPYLLTIYCKYPKNLRFLFRITCMMNIIINRMFYTQYLYTLKLIWKYFLSTIWKITRENSIKKKLVSFSTTSKLLLFFSFFKLFW